MFEDDYIVSTDLFPLEEVAFGRHIEAAAEAKSVGESEHHHRLTVSNCGFHRRSLNPENIEAREHDRHGANGGNRHAPERAGKGPFPVTAVIHAQLSHTSVDSYYRAPKRIT